MHTFTLAFISCLSLSVHAASIGDSVSQVVTRSHQSLEDNLEFRHPDFASAHSDSFEPAGKISQRHGDHLDPAALSGTPAIHTRQLNSLAKPDALRAPQLDSLQSGSKAATPETANSGADINGAGPVNVYDPSKVTGLIASDIPITVAGVNVLQDIANGNDLALANVVGNPITTKIGNIDTLSGNSLNLGVPQDQEKAAKADGKMKRQASAGELLPGVLAGLPAREDDQVGDMDFSDEVDESEDFSERF